MTQGRTPSADSTSGQPADVLATGSGLNNGVLTATETDQPAAASAHFTIAMRNFHGLLRTNSLGQALVWAKQGALLAAASNDHANVTTSRESFVALILVCSSKFEAMTLHCGNITHAHKTLADIIAESTDCLVNSYRDGNEIPLMVALAIQGFTNILRERVTQISEDELPTSTSSIQDVFEHLDPIVTHASGLIGAPELYLLTPDEKIIAAADAMSNSAYELSWLLPSDWAKAIFYARRSAALITYGPPPDRPGLPLATPTQALTPALQPVLNALPALIQTLSDKQYRESKRRIKAINAIFATLVHRQ